MEALKNEYDGNYIEKLWRVVHKKFSHVERKRFFEFIFRDDWEELQLRGRTTRLREALYEQINLPFSCVVSHFPEMAKDFGGYCGTFFPEYIEAYGVSKKNWDLSLEILERITSFSTAEFAIRPFILKDRKRAMKQMLIWTYHPNEHVRRLASEGCRPRLPWAKALLSFKRDPTPVLPLLENLKEDESLYVRKSVANNLNDISKDHPELVLEWATRWSETENRHTLWIIKHGLRSLLKASHPQALKLIGIDGGIRKKIRNFKFFLERPFLRKGDALEFSLSYELFQKAQKSQKSKEVQKSQNFKNIKNAKYSKDAQKIGIRIEYALYFLRKRGGHGRKVYKLSEKSLAPGYHEQRRRHLLRSMTTRNLNYGCHYLDIIINGEIFAHKIPFYLESSDFEHPYYVYMMLTKRGTIYTGITTDINRRFREHSLQGESEGKKRRGAKYTRGSGGVEEILYVEGASSRSRALKREVQLKKLSRREKEEVCSSFFSSSFSTSFPSLSSFGERGKPLPPNSRGQ